MMTVHLDSEASHDPLIRSGEFSWTPYFVADPVSYVFTCLILSNALQAGGISTPSIEDQINAEKPRNLLNVTGLGSSRTRVLSDTKAPGADGPARAGRNSCREFLEQKLYSQIPSPLLPAMAPVQKAMWHQHFQILTKGLLTLTLSPASPAFLSQLIMWTLEPEFTPSSTTYPLCVHKLFHLFEPHIQ